MERVCSPLREASRATIGPSNISSTPEPATVGMVGGALLGLGLWRRKQRDGSNDSL